MDPFLAENLSPALRHKKILLGVTGSIAAFKACDLIRYLKDCGAEVRVIASESATRFVTPLTLETLSGYPVQTSLWDTSGQGTHHINSARWADLFLIAPASANTIAKLSHGFADDLLSTEALAFKGPLLLAPAMNPAMFEHPALKRNLELLSERNAKVLGPTHGVTACGEAGLGRMLEPEEIVEASASAFYKPQNGQHALVTLGPTRSPLDPVRALTNHSSGKMGSSLCFALLEQGYQVTAVTGPISVALPKAVRRICVQTADEMCLAAQEVFPQCHLFIACAAVLDWSIRPNDQKLKKEAGIPMLTFEPSPDILALLGRQKKDFQRILGFAAETQDLLEEAQRKLHKKHCDALFVNPVGKSGIGFESNENQGFFITADSVEALPRQTKPALARALMDRFLRRFAASERAHARPETMHKPEPQP